MLNAAFIARRRRLGGNPLAAYAAGGINPATVLDFSLDKYLGTVSALSDLTHAATSDRTAMDAAGTLQTVSSGTAITADHYLYGGSVRNFGLRTTPAFKNYVPGAGFSSSEAQFTARITYTDNATTGPDGTSSMHKLVETVDNGVHYTRQLVTLDATGEHVAYIVLKAGELKQAYPYVSIGGVIRGMYVDLERKYVYAVDAALDFGRIFDLGNDLVLCVMGFTETSTSSRIGVRLLDGSWGTTYAGDGSSGLYAGFAGISAGHYLPNFIDTNGSPVTQNADTTSVPAAKMPYSGTAMTFKVTATVERGAGNIFSWSVDGNNEITLSVASDGTITAKAANNTTAAYTATVDATPVLPDDGRVPICAVVRVTQSELNISVNGITSTAVSTGGALPDVSGEDFALGGSGVQTFERVVVWAEDVADAGITEASVDGPEVHAFVVMGQSNGIGRDDYDGGEVRGIDTWMWTQAGACARATIPLDHVDDFAGDMGPDTTFDIAYRAANPGVRTLYIPTADGGTGYFTNDWRVGDVTYENSVSKASAALQSVPGAVIKGVIDVLGETDAANSLSGANFAVYTDAKIADFRSRVVGADSVPFVLGQLGTFLASGSYPTASDINTTIANVGGRNSNAGYASSAGLTDLGDSLHYDAASTRTLGTRLYTALASI